MINDRNHLDFRFWCFAFHHTLALLNLHPDSTGISPYRHWHGDIDFDILKYPIIPFGSYYPLWLPTFLLLNNTPCLVAVLLRLLSVFLLIIHIPSTFGTITKKVTTRGTMKFLGPNPQPTFEYNNDRFQQRNIDALWLSTHSLSLDFPVNTPSKLGGTTTPSSSQIPDKFGVLLICRMTWGVLMLNPLTLLLIYLSRADIIEVVRRNTFLMWVAHSVTLLITFLSAS